MNKSYNFLCLGNFRHKLVRNFSGLQGTFTSTKSTVINFTTHAQNKLKLLALMEHIYHRTTAYVKIEMKKAPL